MKTHADKKQENKSQSVGNKMIQKQSGGGPAFQFINKYSGAIAQRKLQAVANNCHRSQQMAQLQTTVSKSPKVKNTAQSRTIVNNCSALQFFQKKERRTCLSDSQNTGIENVSGHHLNSVKQPLLNDATVIQPAWYDKAGKKRMLELLDKIKGLKEVLEKYPVWKYDRFEYRRITEDPESGAILSDETDHVKGFISGKSISVWGGLNTEEAAATIVHEAKHGQQRIKFGLRKEGDTDEYVKREIEAHLREEAFRQAKGIEAKRAEFRKDGNTDVDAIREYVERFYGGQQISVRRCYPGTDKDIEPGKFYGLMEGREKVEFQYGKLK
jgi:hypothetical protein